MRGRNAPPAEGNARNARAPWPNAGSPSKRGSDFSGAQSGSWRIPGQSCARDRPSPRATAQRPPRSEAVPAFSPPSGPMRRMPPLRDRDVFLRPAPQARAPRAGAGARPSPARRGSSSRAARQSAASMSALAPTMQPSPIFAPSRTVAPMPIRHSSPMSQAWMIAAWPIVVKLPAHAVIVGEMNDGAVLHVGALADRDRVDVAAEHAAIPHAAAGPRRHRRARWRWARRRRRARCRARGRCCWRVVRAGSWGAWVHFSLP